MALETIPAGVAGFDVASLYQELGRTDPYAVEAAYRLVGLELALAAGSELVAAESRGGMTLVAVDGTRPVAALTTVPDPGLSEHFGFECASLGWFCCEDTDRRAAVSALIRASCESLRSQGVSHASIRVTSGDFDATTAIQTHGGYLADTIMTYLVGTVSEERELQFEGQFGDLTLFAIFGEDLLEIDPSVSEYFAGLVEGFYPLSRFHADPRFDNALASSWYGKWCRKAFAGEWADGIILARFGEQPVGFICWKRDDVRSELLGCEFLGSGLGASAGHGSYSVMLDAACESSHFRWAVFDLHVANAPVLRAVGRHPQARQLRAYHTFHYWLGED